MYNAVVNVNCGVDGDTSRRNWFAQLTSGDGSAPLLTKDGDGVPWPTNPEKAVLSCPLVKLCTVIKYAFIGVKR